MKRLAILVGEAIECEKETYRFFKAINFVENIEYVPVKDLLDQKFTFENYQKGDGVFLPGGFAFADHFGAGKLLAYWLKKAKVFEQVEDKGLHVFGACNGFQMLCCSGVFGEGVSLEPNMRDGKRIGFVDRWVTLTTEGPLPESTLRLPVRHGEGRLVFEKLPSHVQAFIKYADPNFENGSREKIAGLMAKRKDSTYWGLMPHPEVALYPLMDPDIVGAEYFPKFRAALRENTGDGVNLMTAIFKYLES